MTDASSLTLPKVYFSKEISPRKVTELYDLLGVSLKGRVACKVHSGEAGNQNYLRPDFFADAIRRVNGTVVECNTAYDGERITSEKHRRLMDEHGWTALFDVDILDENVPDIVLPVPDGRVLRENYIGGGFARYDSMLVLSHFKGHPMGGFGGALKQLSIGCASSCGKAWIHSGGKQKTLEDLWDNCCGQNAFLDAMADAAGSVVRYFKGNTAFVSVMANLSVDCDCCSVAEDPCMADIGILSSLDPVALDRACMDMIERSDDKGRDTFLERVGTRNGTRIISAAASLGYGTERYELITV